MSNDRGSASLYAAALIAVLVSVTVGLLGVGTAVAARHRAQATADLAALGAAGEVSSGPEAACTQARAVAHAMHTAVADCVVDGLDVVVTAEVVARLGDWTLGTAHAMARAGPVETGAATGGAR